MTASVFAVWASLIAAGAAMTTSVLSAALQRRAARTARHEARADARRTEALKAVAALVEAVDAHRRAMWVLEHLRLTSADRQEVREARTETHQTRKAVSGPEALVIILTPELAVPARDAVRAAYALHDAPNEATLTGLRARSIAAKDRFVAAASRVFGPRGAGEA